MRETLLALYQLQQIDSAVLEVEKSAEQYPARISAIEAEVEVLRKELGANNNEFAQKLKDQMDTEGLIREDAGKQQKWKRRLQDLKSAREYQMMSREVDQAERGLREQEDRVVALMGELEEKKKVIDDLASRLKENEDRANKEIKELREKQARLFAEAERVRTGRLELVKKLQPRIVALYEKIRNRKQGIGVVLANSADGRCMGCNVALRPQMMVEIRKLNSIEQCPLCARILVLSVLVSPKESQPEAGT